MSTEQSTEDRPTILLVGGEPWRATVTTVLEKRLESHTLSAPNARRGFDHLERQQIDCVIADYPLNDTDVPTFLQDVQASRPALPTVVYTDDGDERVASDVSVTGGTYVNHDDHDHLDQLVRVVERGIERRQERIDLERDLRQSEELHRVTLNNMTDTILITDENGEFTYICPNIHFIFGYTVEEVREKKSIDALLGENLFDPADLKAQGVLTNIECTATDRAGQEHTLLVNVKRVSIQGGTTLYSCRDITARKRRENALTVLHDTARELLYAETHREIAHRVVKDAAKVLDVVAVAYYLYDVDANLLRPVADTSTETLKPVQTTTDLGECFLQGETAILDSDALPGGPIPEFRQGLCIPLGEHGILFVGVDNEGFNDLTREVADLFAATTEAALDRVEREQTLHERDRTLRQRTRELARLNHINDIIREIDRAIVSADTREEIEQTVCERLTSADRFAFAWIGEPVSDGISPRVWTGDERGYLDAIHEDGQEPAARTIASGERTLISNIATDPRKAPWRTAALSRGYQSVLSVPLAAGALTVYATEPNAIDETLRSVLEELGETVTAAINAIGRKDALLGDSVIVLEYKTSDPACELYRLARAAECSFELRGGVHQTDDGLVAVIATEDVGAIRNAAEEAVGIKPGRLIDAETGLLQLWLPESFIAASLANRGAALAEMEADPDSARLVLEAPTSTDIRTIDDVITEAYPDATLLAQHEEQRSSTSTDRFRSDVLNRLTDRQLEIVQLAYQAGFFESPRVVNGEDLAAVLSISPAAFYQHIRQAQYKLFSTILEDTQLQLNIQPDL